MTSAQWNALYGNVAANTAKCTVITAAIVGRFGVRPGGIYNCRKQRGTGSDPSAWSVHSVAGATDVWPGPGQANAIIAYAKSLPGVWDAWLDVSPGDVHVQIVPNPPSGWVPPCAGGTGGTTAPAGAVVAAQALLRAGCPEAAARNMVAIAARESAWNPASHTYGSGCGPGQCGRPSHTPGAVCEDSWGLWQINWCAHEQTLRDRGITRPQLVSPNINAKAAGIISGGFADLGPWRGLENVTQTEIDQSNAAVDFVYGGGRGHGPPQPGSQGAGIDTAGLAPPANCAEATARKAFTRADVIRGIKANPSVTENVAGSLCSVPIFGQVSCGIAGFLSHLPAYLKIAGGGIVMVAGLAVVVAGATGNTSDLARQAVSVAVRVPGVKGGVERRRAVGSEVRRQRLEAATTEARSRVVTEERRSGQRVKVTSRAAGAQARAAEAEYAGTKGTRDRERLSALRAEGRRRASGRGVRVSEKR